MKEELKGLMEKLTAEELLKLYEYIVKLAAGTAGDPQRG